MDIIDFDLTDSGHASANVTLEVQDASVKEYAEQVIVPTQTKQTLLVDCAAVSWQQCEDRGWCEIVDIDNDFPRRVLDQRRFGFLESIDASVDNSENPESSRQNRRRQDCPTLHPVDEIGKILSYDALSHTFGSQFGQRKSEFDGSWSRGMFPLEHCEENGAIDFASFPMGLCRARHRSIALALVTL